jgi:hypothetical protein
MRIMNMFKTSAALVALVSLAACGACNCNVPGFIAGLTPGAAVPGLPGATPTPVPGTTAAPVVVLPPGVVPLVPTPPPAALSCSQGGANAITLGPALAPFAVLAGLVGTTNVGATIVTFASGAVTGSVDDDLIGGWNANGGLQPVSGFYPSGTDFDGTNAIYASQFNNNPAPPQAAQSALTTAYNTAAGMAPTWTYPGAGNVELSTAPGPANGEPLGTLAAGVYKVTSTASIMTANLTLDGGGNPSSVFVFEIPTSLTTTRNGVASGNMNLIGGASACNIYWQVGSSATLGGATFYGNVLAYTAITVPSAAQITGRLLARNASVSISAPSLITNPGGN